MEGFKSLPKMQCFKVGGAVKNIMKKGGKAEKHEDIKEDKKVIKKAFGMHDNQLHDGEKTDLSGLKKGGRAKKETASVRKYKTGGLVKVSPTGDKKADAPSKGADKANYKGSDVAKTNKLPAGSSKAKEVSERPKAAAATSGAKGGPNKYKTGGGVKKFNGADGSFTGSLKDAATSVYNNIMGTPAQNDAARIAEAKYLRAKQLQKAAGQSMGAGEQMAMGLAGAGQALQPAPQATMPAQKCGGKVKKMNTGGTAS
jgi:hypothetical protein